MNLFDRYGVEDPRVFGSVVKGLAREDSDVDFIVSWPAQHSLFDRIRLKNELEAILQKHVDLVTDESLHPLIRDSVLKEAKYL